ncbi:Eukaryotic translation initiation factor 1b [Coemansia sp. RSA 1286]|nr:Eukaryotic translation initiation factor 1b [Coemansia sp. RSA 485]KAJ2638159.1 Eukaryotic translation initiation factor 1b [Coemansia sp. RSA 1286]
MTEKILSKNELLDSGFGGSENGDNAEISPMNSGTFSDDDTKPAKGQVAGDFSDSDEEKPTKKSSKKKKQKKPVNDDFDDMDDEEALLNSRPAGTSFDPFEADAPEKKAAEKLHIRVQIVKGRKTVTTLAGLDPKFDLKKMTKYFKATYGCIGKVISDEEHGDIIQLSGDHRPKMKQFLIDEKIATNKDIVMHGF